MLVVPSECENILTLSQNATVFTKTSPESKGYIQIFIPLTYLDCKDNVVGTSKHRVTYE